YHVPTLRIPLSFHSLPPLHSPLPSFPTRRSSDLTSESKTCFRERPLVAARSRARFRTMPLVTVPIPRPRADSLPSSTLFFLVFIDRKSTRLNSSHGSISYAVFCLKKKIM